MTTDSLIEKLEEYRQGALWAHAPEAADAIKGCIAIVRQHETDTSTPVCKHSVRQSIQSEIRLLDPDMPAQEMRLVMGEMTAQEMRTARAAIRWANAYATFPRQLQPVFDDSVTYAHIDDSGVMKPVSSYGGYPDAQAASGLGSKEQPSTTDYAGGNTERHTLEPLDPTVCAPHQQGDAPIAAPPAPAIQPDEDYEIAKARRHEQGGIDIDDLMPDQPDELPANGIATDDEIKNIEFLLMDRLLSDDCNGGAVKMARVLNRLHEAESLLKREIVGRHGYEISGNTIYIGPMRADGVKVADIVCTIDWDETYTEESKARRLRDAERICRGLDHE